MSIDITSPALNEACWKLIEVLPCPVSNEVFNHLKPAMKEAIELYLELSHLEQRKCNVN
jgi:hypothetical protein